MNLKDELEVILNKHNMESASDTPDYVLAEYLLHCLNAFNLATQQRAQWYTFNHNIDHDSTSITPYRKPKT